jgi:diguanylate cyclase (GGDEF)-like protein
LVTEEGVDGEMMNSIMYFLPVIALLFIAILYVVKQNTTNKYLNNATHQLFSLLSISQDAILILGENNTITYSNDAMSELLKIKSGQEKLAEINMPYIYIKGTKKKFKEFLKDHCQTNYNELSYFQQLHFETNKLGKVSADLYLGNTYEPDTRKKQVIVVIRDLREVFKQIASGERDPLTMLPNRSKSYSDFRMICSRHHLNENKVALMMVGIDDFSITQSLLGHEQADKTILIVSKTLRQLSESLGFRLYHLAYSNFMLIFPNVESNENIFLAAEKIQEGISRLYEEHKSSAYLTASVGIATIPESGKLTALFDKAHQALIEARAYGIGSAHLHKEIKIKSAYDESSLRHDIQYAAERDELIIYYQPIVKADTHKVVAAEALMRWKHPEHGLIPPFVFIPLMEQTGFIVEAGKYLIKEVIQQQSKWKTFGFEEIVLSLNASMREFESSDYISYISEQLQIHHIPPSMIKVEITESLTMKNVEKMFNTLTRLRGAGISLSLDDFGTGYTSFSYLTKMPASTLKIDKSFIDDALHDKKSQQVIQAIIEVGHMLEMDIVAEGIETKEMADLLLEYGCDYLQGYYFSKPVPAFEIQGMLTQKYSADTEHKLSNGEEILPLYKV